MKKKAEMQALREAETAIKENISKEKAVRSVFSRFSMDAAQCHTESSTDILCIRINLLFGCVVLQEIIRKRLQKKQWKEENEKKSLVYQVITNTDKIKKMSRKQLRLVRKMDTNPSAAKHAPKNSKKV